MSMSQKWKPYIASEDFIRGVNQLHLSRHPEDANHPGFQNIREKMDYARKELGHCIQTAIANFGYFKSAQGHIKVNLSENGKIIPELEKSVFRDLPFQIEDDAKPEFSELLYRDFLEYCKSHKVSGDWGTVIVEEDSLQLELKPLDKYVRTRPKAKLIGGAAYQIAKERGEIKDE